MKKIIKKEKNEKRKMKNTLRKCILFFLFSLFSLLFSLPLAAEDAEFYFERGEAYFAEGEMELAIEAFTRAIELDPDNANAWFHRGRTYYYITEFDFAMEDFNQAIALDPDWVDPWLYRGHVYNYKDELELAIGNYSQAIALDPENANLWNYRGDTYRNKGEFDRAIEDLSQAIALDPNDIWLWTNRGDIYRNIDDLEKAIEDFSQSIALDPDDAWLWAIRGDTYRDIGDLEKAFNDHIQVIALESDSFWIWLGLGDAHSDKGNFDRAIEYFNQAIAISSDWSASWISRGNVYREKGELDQAIEDYSQAIALDPDNGAPWNNRGIAYHSKDEFDRAIEDYSQAIALAPDRAFIWYNRGNAYYDKGELDRSIEDYSQAIALDPDRVMSWNNRGRVYSTKGEFDRAIEDYSQTIALDPELVNPWINRGNAYSFKGELDRAIEDYSQAIALDPNHALPWNNRGIAYIKKGELDRAIEDLNQAIAVNPGFILAWNSRGGAYIQKGELDRGIEDINQAIALDPYLAYFWLSRGSAYREKGEHYRAIEDFRQAIEVAYRSSNMLEMFFNSWEFAGYLYQDYPFLDDILIENGFYEQFADLAREALGRSIAKAENVRSALGARGAGIMTGLLYQYYAAVDFEIRFGSAERAFAFSEGLRSRGFLEQMGTEAALKLPGINPEDAQRVRDLIREVGNLQELIAGLDSQREPERVASAGIALSRAEQALAVLDGQISLDVPHYAELRNPSIVSLTEAQAFSGEDRVILEYVIWDSSVEFNAPATDFGQSNYQDRPSINSYCLVITKDGITPVRLDPHFDYAANVNNLRSRLLRVREGIPPHEVTFETYRNELYNALIKPVLEHIPGNIKNILIVPDSNLAFLPFDILRENPYSPNLGEQFNISLSPSVSVSILSKQNDIPYAEPIIAFGGVWYNPGDEERSAAGRGPDVDSRLAALDRSIVEEDTRGMAVEALMERTLAVDFFNIERNRWTYLAGATDEVLGLERITSVEPSILLGGEASMHNVKELSLDGTLLNYPIVHFALHGFFNDNLIPQAALVFSEYSGLLGDKSEEDGFLSIEDIALLQLNARMVTLSACETGIGRINRGDGMSGLARAFMVAGAQNVGVSLWKISDRATVDFMLGVYGKVIGEGKGFREAYSEMKAEFRNSERWSHPYYWAGFTMYE